MKVKGGTISFAVDQQGPNGFVEGEILDSIEEVIEDIAKKRQNLKEDESLDLSIGEVNKITGEYSEITAWPKIDQEELSVDFRDFVLELIQDNLPDDPIDFPHIKKPTKGKKTIPFDDITYVCACCKCESTLCSGVDGFYKVDVAKIDDSINRKPCVVREYEEVLCCPKCFCEIEKCECIEWPQVTYLLDKNISKTILELNKKGYLTYACCEGHEPGAYAYIAFRANYDIDIPENWSMDLHHALRYSFGHLNMPYEEEKEYMIKELEKWVMKLPVFDETFI